MTSDLEPLVPTVRVERVGGALRKKYPALPEDAEFVTFHQAATYADQGNGVMRPIPDVAGFGVQMPNPRYPDRPRLHCRTTTLANWRTWEQAARHNGEIQADPLYLVFETPMNGKTLLQSAIEWWTNMRDMN